MRIEVRWYIVKLGRTENGLKHKYIYMHILVFKGQSMLMNTHMQSAIVV